MELGIVEGIGGADFGKVSLGGAVLPLKRNKMILSYS